MRRWHFSLMLACTLLVALLCPDIDACFLSISRFFLPLSRGYTLACVCLCSSSSQESDYFYYTVLCIFIAGIQH